MGVKLEDVGQDVGNKVAEVGVKVEHVDGKVQVVIDGARGVQSVAKTLQPLFP